jgi:adenosine deaminase CECR1
MDLNNQLPSESRDVRYMRVTDDLSIWQRFDICTRMMKGLFGYESAFRSYTRACIEDFVKDKIQYAEIRPNFPSNVLRCDNGIDTIDNRGMMRIIIAEIQRQRAVNPEADFGGLKVIYCCPRSFSNEKIKDSLIECIQLKEEFPDLMCGKS